METKNMTNNKMQHTVTMSKKVAFYRKLALLSHLLLLTWLAVWYLALNTKQEYSLAFIFILYLLPLILPLYGIIRAKPYTHAWSCFIVLWYFMHAITTMYSEPEYIFHAALELILASAMFVGCSMFARLRGQELGTGLPKLSQVMKQEKAFFEGEEGDK